MTNVLARFALAGRTALVTGGSSGIGLAVARVLAEAGARVIVHGVEPEEALQRLASSLGNARGISLNLAEQGAGERLAERALVGETGIDILVLATGIQYRRAWTAITAQEFAMQIAVNLEATLLLLQRLVPLMQAQRWGRVLTVGSVQQSRPHPQMLVYAATKSAQMSWVRNLAAQVGPDGVTVNNIAPGIIETPRNADIIFDDASRAVMAQRVPLGRVGVPDDCAGAALLLCSDAGSYINGANLAIDGGMAIA